MKRSLLLSLWAVIAALPAFSAGEAVDLFKKSSNPIRNGTCKTITLNGKSYEIGNIYGAPPTREGTDENGLITEPVGETRLYSKTSAGTAVLGNNLIMYEDEFPAEVVWGEGNDVYFKDILSTAPTDTYVKGELDGDMITFKTGQIVEHIVDGPYEYDMAIAIARTEFKPTTVDFFLDESITEYSVKVNKDGSMDLVLPGEPFNGEEPTEYVLCLYYADDNSFAGFSDFYQTYTPEDLVEIKMPFGVEPEQYVYVDDFDYASFVNVAYTDNYIYIEGLDPMMPESVVRAKIEGDKAIIPQNQYQGIYMGMFFIFTRILADNPEFNEKDPKSEPFIYLPEDQGFELKFDREAGKIYADTPGVYLVFQPAEDKYDNALCLLGEFTLTYQATSEGIPANPSRLQFRMDWVTYQGYADFMFNISNYSKEGHLLDVEGLYYSVIVNDERVIFGEQVLVDYYDDSVTAYRGVPERQMWLPFLFNNNEDIFKLSTNEFDIGIYVQDVKTIGVQSMYRHDDVFTYSDIVTLDVETGEIHTTPGDNGGSDNPGGDNPGGDNPGGDDPGQGDDDNNAVEVIGDSGVQSVEYFTLSGIKVDNPRNGIFVKRIKQSNGKVTVSKQFIP